LGIVVVRRSWRNIFLGKRGWQQNKKKRPVAAAERAYNARSGGRLLTTERTHDE
jgi:hypothetical protein